MHKLVADNLGFLLYKKALSRKMNKVKGFSVFQQSRGTLWLSGTLAVHDDMGVVIVSGIGRTLPNKL